MLKKRNFKIEDDHQPTDHADSHTDKYNLLLREDYAQDIRLRRLFLGQHIY